MKFGVVVFPGSNCDADCHHAIGMVTGQDVRYVWHEEQDISDLDCVVLPGGFSYGDYLRCGAIARFSPMMKSVIAFAGRGGKVFGVCNGFQILCEAHLLPGVLLRNANQQFISKNVYIRGDESNAKALKIPIAHGEGRFYADEKTLDSLEANHQVIYRYCDPNGNRTPQSNPNGSLRDIAGICNLERNVFGMMPHPERACSPSLGNIDGRIIMETLFIHAKAKQPVLQPA